MKIIHILYASGLIAILAFSGLGQVVTGSFAYREEIQVSGTPIFKVEPRQQDNGFASGSMKAIAYAIEDELVISGFLPALRTQPAGMIVSFYLEKKVDVDRLADDGSLVVECRGRANEQLMWRGVASVAMVANPRDPYRWEDILAESARMLIRRFSEEGIRPWTTRQ